MTPPCLVKYDISFSRTVVRGQTFTIVTGEIFGEGADGRSARSRLLRGTHCNTEVMQSISYVMSTGIMQLVKYKERDYAVEPTFTMVRADLLASNRPICVLSLHFEICQVNDDSKNESTGSFFLTLLVRLIIIVGILSTSLNRLDCFW